MRNHDVAIEGAIEQYLRSHSEPVSIRDMVRELLQTEGLDARGTEIKQATLGMISKGSVALTDDWKITEVESQT